MTATGATDKRIDTALPGTGADREIDYQYVGTRLSRVVDKDVTQAYSYDDFGSVTRIQSTLNQGGTVFPPVNDLPSDLPPACEGQMSGADSGTTLYCFDEFERMVTARGPGLDEETAVYDYDGLDRRDSKIERTSSGADKRRDYGYVGLSRRLSREQNADGKTLYYDYSANGEREGQAKAPSGQTDRPPIAPDGKDANGSVEELEEHDGSTPEDNKYVYDPYGERDVADGQEGDDGLSDAAKDNPFRFEGFYYDSGVKTYDMQARQYQPNTGRFLTQDRYEQASGDLNLQADPLTQNRYAFAGGNPTNNIEFDGHMVCSGGHTCGGSSIEASRRNTEVAQRRPLSARQSATYASAAVSYAAAAPPVKRRAAAPRAVHTKPREILGVGGSCGGLLSTVCDAGDFAGDVSTNMYEKGEHAVEGAIANERACGPLSGRSESSACKEANSVRLPSKDDLVNVFRGDVDEITANVLVGLATLRTPVGRSGAASRPIGFAPGTGSAALPTHRLAYATRTSGERVCLTASRERPALGSTGRNLLRFLRTLKRRLMAPLVERRLRSSLDGSTGMMSPFRSTSQASTKARSATP